MNEKSGRGGGIEIIKSQNLKELSGTWCHRKSFVVLGRNCRCPPDCPSVFEMNFTPFTCKNHPTPFAIQLSRPRNRHYSDLLTMTGGLKTESVSAYC